MLDDDDYDRLVAQIYAAAADASLLPALLEDLRAGFGGSAAALIAFSEAPGQSRVVATRQEAMAEYRRHWDARIRCTRYAAPAANWRPARSPPTRC